MAYNEVCLLSLASQMEPFSLGLPANFTRSALGSNLLQPWSHVVSEALASEAFGDRGSLTGFERQNGIGQRHHEALTLPDPSPIARFEFRFVSCSPAYQEELRGLLVTTATLVRASGTSVRVALCFVRFHDVDFSFSLQLCFSCVLACRRLQRRFAKIVS